MGYSSGNTQSFTQSRSTENTSLLLLIYSNYKIYQYNLYTNMQITQVNTWVVRTRHKLSITVCSSGSLQLNKYYLLLTEQE